MPVSLAEPYELNPQVSLRPESFGALAYHFGNRKLSFLKHPDLVTVLSSLDDHRSLEDALRAAGVDRRRWPTFVTALNTLEDSEMLRART